MGLGLLYTSLRLDSRHEILTTPTITTQRRPPSLRGAERTGCSVRACRCTVILQASRPTNSASPSVERCQRRHGFVAVTWVQSSTGLKSPFAHRVRDSKRSPRAWRAGLASNLCVDGGARASASRTDASRAELADFWVAGYAKNKWLFGPRGTGVLWGRENAWANHAVRRFQPGSRRVPGVDRLETEVRDRPAAR